MPFPNEHAARLKSPSLFEPDSFRRTSGGMLFGKNVPDSIDIIWAKMKGASGPSDPIVPQSLRFDKARWTIEEARKWLSDNGITFVTFEPAEVAASTVVYMHSTTSPFKLSQHIDDEDDDKRKRFRKELIHVGQFINHDDKGDPEFKFGITEESLEHFAATHALLRKNGITIPLPIEHSFDPEKNRGEVLAMDVDVNEAGLPALFGTIVFANAEAEKLADTSDVSIFVPPDWSDGKGNTYVRPVRHVALTDYPTVPGLDKFKIIAASLAKGVIEMSIHLETLQTLAKQLGITDMAEDATPEDVMAAIVKMCKEGTDTSASLTAEVKALKEKVEASEKPKEPVVPSTIAASMTPILQNNREMKIDKLVADQNITPAVAEKLKVQYCDGKTLALSLSADGTSADGFDAIVEALKDNDPVVLNKEETGKQTVKLSQTLDVKTNPVLADAEARAAEAASV